MRRDAAAWIRVTVAAALASAGCTPHPPAAAPALPHRSPSASIAEASIRADMEMLASDAMNGRGSGTRDEWLAATYVASELQRANLEPLGDAGGFVQAVSTPRDEVTAPPVMSVAGRRYTHGHDIAVARVGAAHVSGPLVRVTAGMAVPAGAVLLVSGSPPSAPALAGAAAVLEPDAPRLRTDWTGDLPPVASVRAPWRIVLASAVAAALADAPDGTIVTLDADVRPGRTWNVIARLPGSDPGRSGEAVVLSAHLDHLGNHGPGPDRIFNGADDDASGVTAVLELAKRFAEGPRPARTLIVACFGSEEDGEFGAAHFVAHPPVPLASIVANLEFEMIGRRDPAVPGDDVWLTGFERTTLGPALAGHGAPLVADPRPDQDFFMRSDNITLARRGVVAQTISSFGLHADYHRPSDDLAHIDFAHMTRVIQAFVDPIAWLLNSAFTPAWRSGGQPPATGP